MPLPNSGVNAVDPAETRLTSLAHGGGCGCKLAPNILQQILAGVPQIGHWANLLVGTETSDDAAVFRLTDDLALVATTDFFMPIVDDPFEFGRIAAANALSDVYAMGGTPVLALALLGIPAGRIEPQAVQRILAGGAAMCGQAGVPVAGGHSIDNPEPIYGLVALGTVHPDRIMRNGGARPGDVLLLTKGLGIGIFSAALKQGRLPAEAYRTMLDSATRLNAIGPTLAALPGVHAITDVTGFGLLGHAMEMCRAANLRAVIDMDFVPILPGAAALARDGFATGAATRNWSSYGDTVTLEAGIAGWHKDLLCDPQTSGGLLIAADADAAGRIITLARAAGFSQTTTIGAFQQAPAGIVVRTMRTSSPLSGQVPDAATSARK